MSESPVQRAILVDLLIYGADKPENIARRTGKHANSISRSASQMVEEDLIRNKGGGVYRLTEKGYQKAQSLVRSGYLPYQPD